MKRPLTLGALLLVISLVVSAPLALGATSVPRFAGCVGTSQQMRPHSIVFACGDGNFWISNLRWSAWTSASATAIGIGHQNDCKPYCAAGHFHAYPDVSVRLARPESCTRGRYLFTRVTVRFAGEKLPGEKSRQFTSKAPFLYHSGCP